MLLGRLPPPPRQLRTRRRLRRRPRNGLRNIRLHLPRILHVPRSFQLAQFRFDQSSDSSLPFGNDGGGHGGSQLRSTGDGVGMLGSEFGEADAIGLVEVFDGGFVELHSFQGGHFFGVFGCFFAVAVPQFFQFHFILVIDAAAAFTIGSIVIGSFLAIRGLALQHKSPLQHAQITQCSRIRSMILPTHLSVHPQRFMIGLLRLTIIPQQFIHESNIVVRRCRGGMEIAKVGRSHFQ
mmetsp:Transcript_14651/g.26540  ORF Transcript_14651/g.26540 Transcript_14651/m.26540 type:complete len:236 (+) Transcript_14651:1055-1762(+)